MTYVDRINNLMIKLHSSSFVEVIESTSFMEADPDTSKYSMRRLRERKKFQIGDDFLPILDIPEKIKLVFHFNEGGGSFAGEFNIEPLSNVLTSTYEYNLHNSSMHSEAEIEMLKQFRVFDDHPFSGDFKLAAFYKDPSISPPNLPDIYFYDRGLFFKMNISIFEYYDATIEMAGLTNWQYLFCNLNLGEFDNGSKLEDLIVGLNGLKKLFPENDYSKYEELLHSVR